MILDNIVVSNDFGNITINIGSGGDLIVGGVLAYADEKLNNDLKIWKTYVNYRSGDKVIRSGSGLCGVYDFDPDVPFDFNYKETDTIHSTTAEELATNIFRFYPDLLIPEDQARVIQLLRYHDLGEDVVGDKADDGSTPKDVKFTVELTEFVKKIEHLPNTVQQRLIKDFIMFENANDPRWSDRDKAVLQFAKLCDKTDAPLGALLFETQGREGSLLFKKNKYGGITDQDQKYIDQIGEYSQAGVWTAHMIDTYRDYKFIMLFIRIIDAAVNDVRGHSFPWLYEFMNKRDMDTSFIIS